MSRFAIFLVPVGYRLPLSLGQAAHQQAVKVLNLVVERVDNESAKVKGEPQPEPDGGDDQQDGDSDGEVTPVTPE